MKQYIILGSLLFFICTSCSTYQISPDWDEATLATLSVYRTTRSFHSGNPERPYFYIDDKKIGTLGTGMVITTKVKPGSHSITVREPILFIPTYETERLDHEFAPGGVYYIRYSKDFTGLTFFPGGATATGSSMLSLSDEESFLRRE